MDHEMENFSNIVEETYDDAKEEMAPVKRSRLQSLTIPNARKQSVQICSVVKLFVKKVHPSHVDPWKMSSGTSNTGTGFIIDGDRIVTNAHVVHRGQSILCRAQTGGHPKKFECSIQSIALPLDLAVLKVHDETFFRDKKHLTLVDEGFEHLPHLDDNVTAVGFPTGGSQVSVTRGVVSRITTTGNGVLRVQIDAAINPGNSGGPVFDEKGKVVGVASAYLKNASNIGYIIPSTVLHLFLKSTASNNGYCNAAAHGPNNPDGFCGISSVGLAATQCLENPTLRKYLGLEKREGGLRVLSTQPLGPCCLKPNDVLLSINGVLIGEDGTVQLPGRTEERISFQAIVTSVLPTTPIDITFLRNGLLHKESFLPTPTRALCPRIDGYDVPDPPMYLICGGCVFIQLTQPWMKAKKISGFKEYYGPLTEEGKQIVMLSAVLAHSVNVGYHSISCYPVRSFDSIEVFSLQHLATLIQNSTNPVLEFRLAFKFMECSPKSTEKTLDSGQESSGDEDAFATEFLMVLDREKCKEMDPIIRKNHLISSASSPGIEFDW